MRRVSLRGLAARKLRLVLTALAIVLGVTFVTGTLVLGDTLNRTFDTLVGTVYQHVSFEIRGQARLKGSGLGGVDSTANRAPVPESILPAIRRVHGVQAAFGSVSGYAQFIDRHGDSINDGSALGFSFDPNPQLSALRLVEGHAPQGPDQVVMDRGTASKNHFSVGDRVRMLVPSGHQTFTISGIVTFGTANDLAGTSLAAFSLPVAQRLFHAQGQFDAINILASPGANDVGLQRAIEQALPRGVEVVSGQTVADELHNTINNALSFLTTALLIFGFIALFVGAFTIFNTFSITIGQRTRELALLRLVGAGRRQVFGSVILEAAVTGVLASIIGLGLGVAAALGLKALLGAFGLSLPSAPLVFRARTPIVALAVGVGVTVLSAIVPAWRAVRIPPVAALVDQADKQPAAALRRRRQLAGGLIGLGAVALLLLGVGHARIALVGLGALALFIATVMLVPAIARPLSSLLGRPVETVFGMPGRLGRENSMRNPRRTAQTAGALMIGIALVSTIAVLGSSLSSSAKHNLGQRAPRRLHHRRVELDQPVGTCGGLEATGRWGDDGRLPGPVRHPRLAADTRRGVGPGHAAKCRPSRHFRPRGTGAGGGRAAGRRQRRPLQAPARRVGRARDVRADGCDDDAGRRHLRIQPARRQLHHRCRLLRLAL